MKTKELRELNEFGIGPSMSESKATTDLFENLSSDIEEKNIRDEIEHRLEESENGKVVNRVRVLLNVIESIHDDLESNLMDRKNDFLNLID
jgi:hypothetical protein